MADNRFKFQSFNQRISKIKIDVTHRVAAAREIPDDEQDTFFREALVKWSDLNCTRDFVNFNHEVKGLVQSLKQLLFHKDEIFKILCNHLRLENSACFDALLDLMAQLARDLQFEMYGYFEEILTILTKLLNNHDPDIIENTFICLAYIFKYLWRYMVNDLDRIYGCYKSLLANSQKPYIQEFAAESMAFLIRKSKSKDSFLDLLFQSTFSDSSLTEGVGILLFEAIKGVNNMFNSHANDIIKLAIQKLEKDDAAIEGYDCLQVFLCLSATLTVSCKHISKENFPILWTILLSETEASIHTFKNGDQEMKASALKISYLLQFLGLLVSWKYGVLIGSLSARILKLLEKILSIKCPFNCQDALLDLFAKLIHSSSFNLPRTDIRNIMEMIFEGNFEVQLISNFLKHCREGDKYQELLLPIFSRYIENGLQKNIDLEPTKRRSLVKLLTEHIADRNGHFIGPFKSTIEDKEKLFFMQGVSSMNLRKGSRKSLPQFLVEEIDSFCKSQDLLSDKSSLDFAWCCVVSLPFVRPIISGVALKGLQNLVKQTLSVATKDRKKCDSLLFLTSQAIRSFYLIKSSPDSSADTDLDIGFDDVLSLLRSHPSNVHVLQAFECYCKFMATQEEGLLSEQFQEVFEILRHNLAANVPITRRLTLLTLFHLSKGTENSEDEIFKKSIIEKCLRAEEIPSKFENYLERLLHSRKLVYKFCESKENQRFCNEVVIRWLVGNLQINLRPMWQPIMEIIKSYAVQENAKEFWEVFRELLLAAFADSEDETCGAAECNADDTMLQFMAVALESDVLSRPDRNNFCLLILQTMEMFPGIAETKSRDLMPVFFKFLSDEYERLDDSFSPTQDLGLLEGRAHADEKLEEPEDTAAENDNDTDGTNEQRKTPNRRKESSKKQKTLEAFLKLFSQFKNPRALFKEPKLYQVYLQLLMHRDNDIQQSVCNCLKTYKFAYMKPYEEHFDKLFQENTFKDELTLFAAGSENDILKKEHRGQVMNILIRLLYGKLQRRSGLGVSGKTNQSARRNIIINFISCCPDEEISTFIQLITEPFKSREVEASQSIYEAIPLRKQIGFLNMLHTVLSRLSNLILPHADHLFKTLLNILSTCQFHLESRSKINPTFIPQLKSIRQLCISRILEFFESLPEFDFLPYEEMIFRSAVIPQVSRLHQESQQQPSNLLKLLNHWSSTTKYHKFLDKDLSEYSTDKDILFSESSEVKENAKPSQDESENDATGRKTPLGFMYMILSAKDKSEAVVKIVMKITENLLLMKHQTEATAYELQESNTALPSGSAIQMMHAHVDTLLAHLCEAVKRKKMSQLKRLQKDETFKIELSVLALISSFAKDQSQCRTLVSILLPTLKSISNETDQANTLVTIRNLIRNCENMKQFEIEMVQFFMILKSRKSRSLLCELYQIVSESNDISCLIRDMNSWDTKYVDEPDFERRIQAFSKAVSMVKAGELPIKLIKALLVNALYFSVEVQEMSLRDASINLIIHVVEFVKTSSRVVFDDLVIGLILPVLKKALRSKNEIVRGEYVSILSSIVRSFGEVFISDMKVLTSDDPDVDFFENIKHIQIHRRIRAVRLLSQLAKEEKLKQNSLYFFLLPLVSHFLFDTAASKDHNLVTTTIEAVGAIVSVLPWQRYSHVLRSYLRLLHTEKGKSKIIVRIVAAILDAFHYDLLTLKDDDVKKELDTAKSSQSSILESNSSTVDDVVIESEADNEEETEAEMINSEADDVVASIGADTSKSSKLRIHNVICGTILPQLHKAMIKKSFVEDFHRKSHNKEKDDDVILRVPIALAIVKLLQKLPKATLHEQLPGLLLRVCQTLKSRTRDVRDTARETLVNIAASLGPEYFSYILKEMRTTLQRGYQLHVLAFTLKSIFDGLLDQLKPGDLDSCLSSIIEVLMQDVFGNVAEEKEIEGITGKLFEARSTKSYDSFEIISQFATASSFGNIIAAMKELLEGTHTHKVSNKAKEVLRRISLGLQSNSVLTLKDLLVFIHQTLADLRPQLLEKTPKDIGKEEAKRELAMDNIFLVKKEPGRGKKTAEHDKKANLHLLAEFGLQMLHSFLKNQKLLPSNEDHIGMLDPYVQVLIDCLKSKYNRVITLAAKSIALIMRFPLPSLEANTKSLAATLFKLLKNYARIGAGTGDNYELVLSAFKAMTVIIRDNKKFKVTDEQLKILLAFVEEDVYDYTRQATAFPLLKAILSRKLKVQEISDVMKKIAELSITSESDSVQLQCRQLMLQYLLDYPLGKAVEKHLGFYVSHLQYELENGRKSALEMMVLIFKNFPEKRLHEFADFFYFPLVMRLVNDESSLCRKMSNAVLKALLLKLDVEKRTELFDVTLKWFQQTKVSVKRLGIQAIGIFSEVEGASFEKRLAGLLPSIVEAIRPSFYDDQEDDDTPSDEMRESDQFLFNTLTSIMKVFKNCDIIKKPAFQKPLDKIWESVENHLQYPHTWVRLVSCQLFGSLFAVWQPTDLIQNSFEETERTFYITRKLPLKVKLLSKDFCEQLKTDGLGQEFGDQITKNLIYIIKVINCLEHDTQTDNNEETKVYSQNGVTADENDRPPTLRWLLNKLSYLATFEASQEQKSQIKRICVFRCLAAAALDLGKERIKSLMIDILRPLYRELVSSSPESDLYKLAQEVLDLVKEIVGKEYFAEMYAKVQRKVSEKKELRKRKGAEEAIVDPEKYAKRKQKKNLQKRDQRKRKLIEKKPTLLKSNNKRSKPI